MYALKKLNAVQNTEFNVPVNSTTVRTSKCCHMG